MKWYQKFNLTLLHWATDVFSKKIRNLSLCRKLFEHCRLVQNFTPVYEMIMKIQSDPPLGYGIYFKNGLADFLKMFPGFFRVLFFTPQNIFAQILDPPSVRLSVHPQFLGLFMKRDFWTVYIIYISQKNNILPPPLCQNYIFTSGYRRDWVII